MAKPATRIGAIQALLALGALGIFGRSLMIQVVEQSAWQRKADLSRTERDTVPARRGTIFDRNGVPLAVTQERYRLSITQSELTDTARVLRLLAEAGFTPEKIRKAFLRPYPYFSEPLSAEQIEPLRGLPGVHPEPLFRRVYPLQRLASPWLGGLDDQGHATGGIESAYDTLLTGVAGEARYLIDGSGRRREAPSSKLRAPVPGNDVYLTIDHELQGIAEGELLGAVDTIPALGGDVVILDIHTGEILAIASLRRDDQGRIIPTTSAVVEPMEPGSTAKIFTAAAVLRNHADTSAVPGHGGKYIVPNTTRTIADVHAENGPLTLGETIKVSSNVGISQFALRLRPEQQFTTLRDFGFGTPPAVGFPGEAEGVLYRPPWTNHLLSMPSLAQGYEFMVTSLQMAAAYGAIANGGMLMAPSLVREVRGDGITTPLWRHQATPVRRSVSPEVAMQLRAYLRLATDSGGSGAKAQLDFFSVIGKTATAKIRPYLPGVYRSAFAGLFPGDDPQLVIYVMIDRPAGAEFYGGLVAAPLVRRMLLQALAAETSPLDRRRLDASVTGPRAVPTPRLPGNDPVRSVMLPLVTRPGIDSGSIVVPTLTGLSPRAAAASLHRLGLRVKLTGSGTVSGTVPEAGVSVPRGSTISLQIASGP